MFILFYFFLFGTKEWGLIQHHQLPIILMRLLITAKKCWNEMDFLKSSLTHPHKKKQNNTNKQPKLHSNNGSNWIKSPQWWCSWSSYWPEKAWNLRQQIEQQVSSGTWPSLFSNSLVKSPQSPLLYMVRHANNPAKKLVTTHHQKKKKKKTKKQTELCCYIRSCAFKHKTQFHQLLYQSEKFQWTN